MKNTLHCHLLVGYSFEISVKYLGGKQQEAGSIKPFAMSLLMFSHQNTHQNQNETVLEDIFAHKVYDIP